MALKESDRIELANLWRFASNGYERAPRTEEIEQACLALGCGFPDQDDRAAARAVALAHHRAMLAGVLPRPKLRPEDIAKLNLDGPKGAPVAQPKRQTVPTEAAGWEAQIKVMKWPELKVLLDRNKIVIEEVAPNPGIRTMRGRNALYAALRRGVVLK